MNLLERHRRVEPVEGLSDDDAVDCGVFHRNRDVATVEDVDGRQSLAQDLAHAGRRLDRRDLRAERNQLTGEYSGARPQVEDVGVVIDAQ